VVHKTTRRNYRRKIRGVVISTEAILYSAIISIIVFLAFWYLSSYLMSPPKYTQGYIDAKYCGTVLVIKNTGSVAVRINYIIGIKLDGTSDTPRQLNVNLNPGETWHTTLTGLYKSLTIVGENFATVTVKNECIQQ